MKKIPLCILTLCILATEASADSVFDRKGLGREPIPAIGITRAVAGANVATNDASSASILAPFAAVYASKLTVTGGFAHVTTRSTYPEGQEQTIVTIFPALSVVVPLKAGSILTGFFEEKLGKLALTASDTAYSVYPFTIKQTRETSIHSVPLFAVTKIGKFVASGGFIFSFFDSRQTTKTDFASDELDDSEDTFDMSADGKSFGAGLLADLDFIALALFYRTATDLRGSMECQNRYSGIYSTKDFTLSSQNSIAAGLRANLAKWFELQASYYLSPWSQAKLDTVRITSGPLERWAIGIRYMGSYLWNASKYPLLAGYYRQPLDWPGLSHRGKEEVFSIGTVIPIGEDRASLALSVEMGKRNSEDHALKENFVGFSLSITAKEVWRHEVKR